MEFQIQYHSDVERGEIINANTDKYLIVEKNIREGNFLVFSTVKPTSEEIRDLKQEIEELRQIIDILLGGEDNE